MVYSGKAKQDKKGISSTKLWEVKIEAKEEVYRNWTLGQLEVYDRVVFYPSHPGHYYHDGWHAIDNITFTYSNNCVTIPSEAGKNNTKFFLKGEFTMLLLEYLMPLSTR